MRRAGPDPATSPLSTERSATELTARHLSLLHSSPSWNRTSNLRDVSAALCQIELPARTYIGPGWNRATGILHVEQALWATELQARFERKTLKSKHQPQLALFPGN
jgi:hypothetical protein